MKNLLYLFFLIFLLFRACAPTESIYAGKIGANNEMPRYCLQPRLLFYEVLVNENWVRLWLHTNNSITKGQLLKNPLKIYIAEKNKRNIIYFLKYKNVFDSKVQEGKDTTKSHRQLVLYELSDEDTTDVTSKYNFKVTADLDDQQYDLKIDCPRHLISGLEEPVIGIESLTNIDPDNSERVNLRTSPESVKQYSSKLNTASNRDYPSRQKSEYRSAAYHSFDLDIELWFKLYLSQTTSDL